VPLLEKFVNLLALNEERVNQLKQAHEPMVEHLEQHAAVEDELDSIRNEDLEIEKDTRDIENLEQKMTNLAAENAHLDEYQTSFTNDIFTHQPPESEYQST